MGSGFSKKAEVEISFSDTYRRGGVRFCCTAVALTSRTKGEPSSDTNVSLCVLVRGREIESTKKKKRERD